MPVTSTVLVKQFDNLLVREKYFFLDSTLIGYNFITIFLIASLLNFVCKNK